MTTRSWTDEQLREAAASSRTQTEVFAKLGLRKSGGAHRDVRAHADRLGITLPMGEPAGGRTWTDDDLRREALKATSMKQLTVALGLWSGGPTNRVLRAHADRLKITLPDRSRGDG
jgi:hypothetical protein